MGHLEIREASPGQAPELAALARVIWREHFTPIIGAAQVEYMLGRFQSEEAVRGQMEREGFRYFFFLWDGERAGYLCFRPEADALFLSKLYVRKEFRGRKIARAATDFLLGICREKKLGAVRLTCNKHNAPSLAAYRALGFRTVRPQVTPIGGGFVMDDYVLEQPVPAAKNQTEMKEDSVL